MRSSCGSSRIDRVVSSSKIKRQSSVASRACALRTKFRGARARCVRVSPPRERIKRADVRERALATRSLRITQRAGQRAAASSTSARAWYDSLASRRLSPCKRSQRPRHTRRHQVAATARSQLASRALYAVRALLPVCVCVLLIQQAREDAHDGRARRGRAAKVSALAKVSLQFDSRARHSLPAARTQQVSGSSCIALHSSRAAPAGRASQSDCSTDCRLCVCVRRAEKEMPSCLSLHLCLHAASIERSECI